MSAGTSSTVKLSKRRERFKLRFCTRANNQTYLLVYHYQHKRSSTVRFPFTQASAISAGPPHAVQQVMVLKEGGCQISNQTQIRRGKEVCEVQLDLVLGMHQSAPILHVLTCMSLAFGPKLMRPRVFFQINVQQFELVSQNGV